MATSLEKWQTIVGEPNVVEFFYGLFDCVGIVVSDTGEQFHCKQREGRLELAPGIDPARIDYQVSITSAQVDRLVEETSSGVFTPLERFRIVSALFTPATASLMRSPVVSNPLLRVLSGSETLIHAYLRAPGNVEPEVAHTLIYVDCQWLVIPGVHGTPRRIYVLDADEAVRYQRHFFHAVKEDSFMGWLEFSRWYRVWRTTVSVDVH
jgi:hypothetical protein